MEKFEDGEQKPKQPEKSEAELKAEQELVERILQHDTEAFGEFFGRYYADIESFVYLMVRDTEEAKDITREAFFRLLINLPKGLQFGGFKQLMGYLYKIASNLSVNFLEKKKKSMEAFREYEIDEKRHQNEFGQTVEMAEMLKKMEAAIEHLTDLDREMLDQFYKQDKKIKDIAEFFGISYENAKKIKRRAENKLTKILKNGLLLCALFKALHYLWQEISHYF